MADKGSLLVPEGFVYPAKQIFNYLSSQISSVDTNIIASPTVILSENADSLKTDADSGDTIGRSRANEALVKVGNSVVTGYKLTKEEFIKGDKIRQLNDEKEEEMKQKYCYKPYRNQED